MPDADVDRLQTQYPGFVAQKIVSIQARIEARLRKRYAIPFGSPAPEVAIEWLVALVTLALYQRRGWNPSSAENALIVDAAKLAGEEIKEAADSESGLFDLPLRADAPTTTGIAVGGPFVYSEASPYVWTTVQGDAAASEDSNGVGS